MELGRGVQRDTAIVMSGLVAAGITAFVRHAVVAYVLGARARMDTFLVSYAVPELVLVAMPIVLAPALIPILSSIRARAGDAAAWRFAATLGALLTGALSVALLAAGLTAPFWVKWLSPGFDEVGQRSAVVYARLMLPSGALTGLAAVAGVTLQSYRSFAVPAFGAALYNVAFSLCLLFIPVKEPLTRASVGVVVASGAVAAVQVSVLWWRRPKVVMPLAFRSGQMAEWMRGFFTLCGPVALGYMVHHFILFADRSLATTLGVGAAAALNYAYHVALVVGQLSGLAVSTAVFPRLSEQLTHLEITSARRSLSGALKFVWLLGLPAAAGLVVLRQPVVSLLLQRGAFSPAAVTSVGRALVWYAPAVLADALCQPLWRAVYAQRSRWAVLAINGVQSSVRVAVDLTLIRWVGFIGIAVSAACGLCLQVFVLALVVQRHMGPFLRRGWWLDAASGVLATAAAVVAVSLPALKWTESVVGQAATASLLMEVVVSLTIGSTVYLVSLVLIRRLLHAARKRRAATS
jgi:putative peptidoglycan lipid II flippase